MEGFEAVAAALRRARGVVVLTGAGVVLPRMVRVAFAPDSGHPLAGE